jgi:hypothetical protein
MPEMVPEPSFGRTTGLSVVQSKPRPEPVGVHLVEDHTLSHCARRDQLMVYIGSLILPIPK